MISKVATFITKQLKQKKRLLLKSLFVLLLWFSFLPQQSYFSFNEVHAAETTVTQEQMQKNELASMDTFMDALSKIAFTMLWPLVALAWLAMDNTLIYWSFMDLDISLWNVWQIVRSFANYTLWFLFLFWILYWNFTGETWIKNIKLPDLLKKILLASVLIQASWFIMMVLIDLSTILTYSIWWLPMSIIREDSTFSGDDYRMFKMNVDLNLWNYNWELENNWDTSEALVYYWHITWENYVAPCSTAHAKFWDNEEQSFIIGRSFESFSWHSMLPWLCMYYWSLIAFNDFYVKKDDETYKNTLTAFKNVIEPEQGNTNESNVNELVNAWIIYPLTSWKVPYYSWNINATPVTLKLQNGDMMVWGTVPGHKCERIWIVSSQKVNNQWECLYNETDITVWNILKKSSSMTWPFTALYSSMSVYSHLQTDNLWLWQKFIVTFVNLCFSVMLVLPLLALVIVLFARVWLLWIAIALSPFLVLATVFKDVIKLPESLKDYINFGELIKLLLAPVLISFAVWMSLIFMKTLQWAIWTWADWNVNSVSWTGFFDNLSKITWMEVSWSEIDFLWFIKIKLDSTLLNISWLLTMMFGLWITWFLLFWAIKQTKIWGKIWTTLQNLWETALKTTPIIPVGQHGLSWKWLTDAPDQIYNDLTSGMESRDAKKLQSLFDLWKTDYSKQVTSFYDNNANFETTFWNSYSDTSGMLNKIDALTKDERWTSRSADIWLAYHSALENAGTVKNLEKIVSNMNSKWENDGIKNALTDKKYKVGWKEYEVVVDNWKYQLKESLAENPTDAN